MTVTQINCFDDHKISSQRYILIHCCHTKNELKHISACFRGKSVKMMYACSAEYSEELIKISQDALIFINSLEKCKHGLGSYILRKNWQKTKFYLLKKKRKSYIHIISLIMFALKL